MFWVFGVFFFDVVFGLIDWMWIVLMVGCVIGGGCDFFCIEKVKCIWIQENFFGVGVCVDQFLMCYGIWVVQVWEYVEQGDDVFLVGGDFLM